MTLNLEREKDFVGKGISTCAVCDAAFYREKEVYVVGGGDSAIEDTMALTKFTDKVHLVVRRDELRASKIMQERILKNPKVKMLWNTEVKELIGEDKLTGLKIVNNKSGEEFEVSAEGLFYAIGHKPNSKFLEGAVKTDDKGYILTPLNGLEVDDSIYDVFMHKYMTMTSVPGVFAAGDVVDFRYKQAVTAAAYGCMSALDVERWLENNNSA
jgi:thioredoxin reductase (NADPH)